MRYGWRIQSFLFMTIVATLSGVVRAEALRDAMERDDDISGAEISQSVSVNQAGHYVYKYEIKSPVSNIGLIQTLEIDISCQGVPESQGFSPSDYKSWGNESADSRHVPVAINDDGESVYGAGITRDNNALWSMTVKPGESSGQLSLVSPYAPAYRTYQLRPSFDYQWDLYNYDELADPTFPDDMPSVEDWAVTGNIVAPACPGNENPALVIEKFAGTVFYEESGEVNKLLQYTRPQKDQFHVPATKRELEVTIHYHEKIDPETFTVISSRDDLRQLFNPEPGATETVRIPV